MGRAIGVPPRFTRPLSTREADIIEGIRPAGAGWEVLWNSGTLQEASSVTGTWTDVAGATPPSYSFTAGTGSRFFRTRN